MNKSKITLALANLAWVLLLATSNVAVADPSGDYIAQNLCPHLLLGWPMDHVSAGPLVGGSYANTSFEVTSPKSGKCININSTCRQEVDVNVITHSATTKRFNPHGAAEPCT